MSAKQDFAKKGHQRGEQNYAPRMIRTTHGVRHTCDEGRGDLFNTLRQAPSVEPPMLLSREDLREFCGITYSRWHLQRLIARGLFPAPVALGPEASARKAWRRDEIETWIKGLARFEYTADHT
jgi:predicted DNA-binding transcriptional regulator AlpA